jgi:hypothetical protein
MEKISIIKRSPTAILSILSPGRRSGGGLPHRQQCSLYAKPPPTNTEQVKSSSHWRSGKKSCSRWGQDDTYRNTIEVTFKISTG